ncbi:nose resistant to fluoxetine protein 6-like [Cydia strobilella]|uniref:nose resistant to fluoxetine protein 6-like n=1 Tax=Cydia strobilella TaxID=1100964 RepID=UPI00300644FB
MDTFEFYDASFRFPQNMLRGNVFSLGNYHQCLAINQPEGIRGKYCLIQTHSLQIPILAGGNVTWAEIENVWSEENLRTYEAVQEELALSDEDISRTSVVDIINGAPSLTLALCVPRPCKVADVLQALDTNFNVQFNYTEQFCRLPDDKPYSGADITALVIFSIIGCLTLASTAYELNHIFIKKENNNNNNMFLVTTKPDELRSCFSVYGNTDRLLTLASKPGALDCLDGIRALSILWVMTGHSFLAHLNSYLSNYVDLLEWSANIRAVYILSANLSVDSFFVLSGLLLVYTAANKMKPMQLIKNLHLFYLHRLLRMFPLLAAAVLLQASVFHHVSDGVRWNRVAWEAQKCRDHWWSALLHIQNLVNPRGICVAHSWYLSVDVQLHILSPLVLFWVLGSRRSAWAGLAAAILCSLTFVTVYSFLMNFTGNQLDDHYSVYFYRNTLARSPVFIIGMLCGYVLHVSRNKKIVMPWWSVCFGHTLALVLSGYCMYHEHPEWSQLATNFNTALVRPAWAVSLCWLIVACVNGYAGPINWFLSINLWKFVARISYSMYIFHLPMQFIMVGANIMPMYFHFEGVFKNLASDVAYAVIVAVVMCVLVDAPFSTLIRRLMAGMYHLYQFKVP